MISLTPKQIARFWMNIKQMPNGCWEWQLSLSTRGYGRVTFHPKTYRAHIISFSLTKGEIPKGKLVCHSCDNPKCVNPSHLFLGTQKENVQDMIKKGRLSKKRSKHADSKSQYPGVSLRKESGKWRARIMRDYHTVWCKEFETEDEAHEERIRVLRELDISYP